jgi:phage shock protein A
VNRGQAERNFAQAMAEVERLSRERDKWQAEAEKLREALEPFAQVWLEAEATDDITQLKAQVTLGDYRRAARCLNPKRRKQDGD